jgi:hypothetical protein
MEDREDAALDDDTPLLETDDTLDEAGNSSDPMLENSSAEEVVEETDDR